MRFIAFASLFFMLFNHLILFSFQDVNYTFRATNEWQTVEKGMVLRAGLRVRFDFRENRVEAKIPSDGIAMDEDAVSKALMLPVPVDEAKMKAEANARELKEVLKKIQPKEYLKQEGKEKKYHSYIEIKKQLDDDSIKYKTDFDIIFNLIWNFKLYNFRKVILPDGQTASFQSDNEVLADLVDLEYMINHNDNALEFARLNGFVTVVHKCLKSDNSNIRIEALRLHGSVTQNNPDTQLAAFEAGSIPLLLRVLFRDKDEHVQAKSLYALSCLVRQYPAAQYKMIFEGGLSIFASIFDDYGPLKLQLKVAILFQDLLIERKDLLLSIMEEESKNFETPKLIDLKEKLEMYNEMKLDERLVELDWCSRIPNWIVSEDLIFEFLKSRDVGKDFSPRVSNIHSVINLMIGTVYVVSDMCEAHFQNNEELIELIYDLSDVYRMLAVTEIKDDRKYNNIYSNLSSILKIIKTKLDKNFLPVQLF